MKNITKEELRELIEKRKTLQETYILVDMIDSELFEVEEEMTKKYQVIKIELGSCFGTPVDISEYFKSGALIDEDGDITEVFPSAVRDGELDELYKKKLEEIVRNAPSK